MLVNDSKRTGSIDPSVTFWRAFVTAVRQGPSLYFAPIRWLWKLMISS